MHSDGSILGSSRINNYKLLLEDYVVLQFYIQCYGKQLTRLFTSNLSILLEISSGSRNIVAIAHDIVTKREEGTLEN